MRPMMMAIAMDDKPDMAHQYIRDLYKKIITWADNKPKEWKTYRQFWMKYDEFVVGEDWIDQLKYLNPFCMSSNYYDAWKNDRRPSPWNDPNSTDEPVLVNDTAPDKRGLWTYKKKIENNQIFTTALYITSGDIEKFLYVRKDGIMNIDHDGFNPIRKVHNTIYDFHTKSGKWRKRGLEANKKRAIGLRWEWIIKMGGLTGLEPSHYLHEGNYSHLGYEFPSDYTEEINFHKEAYDKNWWMMSVPEQRNKYNKWKSGTFTFTPKKNKMCEFMSAFHIELPDGGITNTQFWNLYYGGSNKCSEYNWELDYKVMMRIMGVRKDDDIKLKLVKEFC